MGGNGKLFKSLTGHEEVVVMRGELTASEAGHTIRVHPTLNEMMMEAFPGASSGAINV